jgi:hypothetical protein
MQRASVFNQPREDSRSRGEERREQNFRVGRSNSNATGHSTLCGAEVGGVSTSPVFRRPSRRVRMPSVESGPAGVVAQNRCRNSRLTPNAHE